MKFYKVYSIVFSTLFFAIVSGCKSDEKSLDTLYLWYFLNQDASGSDSVSIVLDQFGYHPADHKIAAIRVPVEGYDAGSFSTPGNAFALVDEEGDEVLSLTPSAWNGGELHTDSGDRVYHLDFTDWNQEGVYSIRDRETGSVSHPFQIGEDVYETVLKDAIRVFFYQRVNFAKEASYAGDCWADEASHEGEHQDRYATLIRADDPENLRTGTERDLHGGWYDAGDYNKYVNFTDGTLHDLLFATEQTSFLSSDALNIPESGNGIPDLLDEMKWELDWLLRMQTTDGSVIHKIASVDWNSSSPPSQDTSTRVYSATSVSATISFAGVIAHAAIVYRDVTGLEAYADELKAAAILAWDWLEANPSEASSLFDNTGFVNADSEDSLDDQKQNKLNAAIYLYALTEESKYGNYIVSFAEEDSQLLQNDYFVYDDISAENIDALFYYLKLDASLQNASLVTHIKESYNLALENPDVDFAPVLQFENQDDPYLAFLDTHYWGSSRAKSKAGTILLLPLLSGVDLFAKDRLLAAATGYLHYLHGMNPLDQVYLTNMGEDGAENSVTEVYHLWFTDGSSWDSSIDSCGPPPGYVAGGANENYAVEGVVVREDLDASNPDYWLKNQPPLKSFRSWNSVEEVSYEITEPSTTYQAAYIRFLAGLLEVLKNK